MEYLDNLVKLLDHMLILYQHDESNEPTSPLLSCILSGYKGSLDEKRSDMVIEYIDSEVKMRFYNLCSTDSNFNIKDLRVWEDFFNFDYTKVTHTYTMAIYMILYLINNSLVNVQVLSSFHEIKGYVMKLLPTVNDSSLYQTLNTMLCHILSVNCMPKDILKIYTQFPNFNLFNSLAIQLSIPSSQSFLQFENVYQLFQANKHKQSYTIHIWLELINTKSNRLVTFGKVFFEIKDSVLCICNDEFILAMFDTMEFDLNKFYHMTIVIKLDNITLFIDGSSIQSVTLMPGFTNHVRTVELGSVICSFRVYRCIIWEFALSEYLIKLIDDLGSTWELVFDERSNIVQNIDHSLVYQIYTNYNSFFTQEDHITQFKKINKKMLLTDLNPKDYLLDAGRNKEQYFISDGNHLGLGKLYYYDATSLVLSYESLNVITLLLYFIARSVNLEELYGYTENLLILLKLPEMRLRFEKEFGYQMLSAIISKIVLNKVKTPLTIEFMNLFLEFCGWNINDNDLSVLINEKAYDNLVLDLELWYSKDLDNQEIVRFLFFQIKELICTVKHNYLNFSKLKKLNIVKKLTHHQHLIFDRDHENNIFCHLEEEVIQIYSAFLSQELTRENIILLLQFAYYEVYYNYDISTRIILRTLHKVYCDTLYQYDHKNIEILSGALSIKSLLMILEGSLNNIEIVQIVLSLMSILFRADSSIYQNFIKNNGMLLLFSLLKNVNYNLYGEIIRVLYDYSFDGCYFLKTPNINIENININNGKGSVILLEYHYLIIDILEWGVTNGILNANSGLILLIDEYIGGLSFLNEKFPDTILFDFKRSQIMRKITDLMLTLQEPQNKLIYERDLISITNLLSRNILNNLMVRETSDFKDYLEYFLNSNSLSSLDVCIVGTFKKINYISNTIVLQVFPDTITRLFQLSTTFEVLFVQYRFIIKNICSLLEKYVGIFSLVELDFKTYVRLHNFILVLMESLFLNTSIEYDSFQMIKLINMEQQVLLSLFYLIIRNRQNIESEDLNDFFESILFHQETLFVSTKTYFPFDNEFISYILIFFITFFQLNSFQDQNGMFNAFRTVLIHYAKELKDIAKLINYTKKDIVYSTLSECIASNDEEINRLVKKDFKVLFSEHLSTFSKYLARKLSVPVCQFYSMNEVRKQFLQHRKSLVENYLNDVANMSQLFKRDNANFGQRILLAENKKLNYFIQDHEDYLTFYSQKLHALNIKIEQLFLLYQKNSTNPITSWVLDTSEDHNRMKKRLVPHLSLNDESQIEYKFSKSSDITLPANCLSKRWRENSSSSSIISFEVINEFELFNLNDIADRDKNRKVLKNLKKGDLIKSIWNCSHIVGLNINEGILILGKKNLYFIADYFFSEENMNVIDLVDAPDHLRDMNINLILGSNKLLQTDKLKKEPDTNFWELIGLESITKRPFLLRDTAVEILFDNGKSSFFSFPNKQVRDDVHRIIDLVPKSNKIDTVLLKSLKEVNLRNIEISIKNGISQTSLTSKFTNVFSTIPMLTNLFEATEKWQNGKISNFFYLIIINTLAGRTFNDLTQYPVFPWIIADYTSSEIDLKNPCIYRDLSKPMGAQSIERMQKFIDRYDNLNILDDPLMPPCHYGTHYSSAMIVSSYLIRLSPFVKSYLLLQGEKFGPPDRIFNSIGRAWLSASTENTTDVRELIPEFYFTPELFMNINNYNFGCLQTGEIVNDVILPPWAKNDPKIFVQKNREALESPYVSQHLHEWIDIIFGFKQKGEEAVKAVNVFNKLSYPGSVDLDKVDDENERRSITGIIHNFGQTPLQIFDKPHPPKKYIYNYKLNEGNFPNIKKLPTISRKFTYSETKEPEIKRLEFKKLYKNNIWKGFPNFYKPLQSDNSSIFTITSSGVIKIGLKSFQYLHHSRISAVEFLKNDCFITGDEFGLIKFWKIISKKNHKIIKLIHEFTGHLCRISEIKIAEQYNTFVSRDIEGNIYIWDIIKGVLIRKLDSNGIHIAISPDSGNIAVLNSQNFLSVYNINGLLFLSEHLNETVTTISFMYFDEYSIDNKHIFLSQLDVILVGLMNGTVYCMNLELSDKSNWKLDNFKTLFIGNQIPISCVSGVLSISEFNTINSGSNIIECEIAAGDVEGFVHSWK